MMKMIQEQFLRDACTKYYQLENQVLLANWYTKNVLLDLVEYKCTHKKHVTSLLSIDRK